MPALLLFRRDLRLDDHAALRAAAALDTVACASVFDPRQCEPHPFRSDNALEFLLDSLDDLQAQLQLRGDRLHVLRGLAHEVLDRTLTAHPFDAVHVHGDHTPFSLARDLQLQQVCATHGVPFHSHPGVLLTEPDQVHKDDGLPYTVFTPFHRKAARLPVAQPQPIPIWKPWPLTLPDEVRLSDVRADLLPRPNPQLAMHGGRTEALALLADLGPLRDYATLRDRVDQPGTSHLSAHLKFGTVSPREVWHAVHRALGPDHGVLRQLYWRDFFTHIARHFPHVFGHAFRRVYDDLPWEDDAAAFRAWCQGQTGFPLVDAGMRELVATGFMHNRARMVTASFLVKDLHLDWQWGERFFAQHLIDYDPAVNNGSWQWSASTGCDAQPYFRVFNPWRQLQRFDPDGVYVRRWVPELRELDGPTLRALEKKRPRGLDYPEPMVDHSREAKRAEAMFR
jgi:deoxyribodipyrimidine photo-lyase